MNDFLKQTIKRLGQEHGDYLYSDINRLRGMLYNACPSYKKEINVLPSVVQAGLITDLKRADVSAAYLHSFSNRLYNETGIDKALAEWGIKAWAEALRLEIPPSTAYCSFCDKSKSDVRYLFARGKPVTTSTVFICDECVELCMGIIKKKQVEVSAAKLYEMETSELQPNPLSARRVILPDSLTDLVESIREQGILEPIVVAKTSAGLQIIAGERRWRAAKILGLKKVPVVVKEATPQGMLEMSIVENIQREDINLIEKALAYRRLIDEFWIGTTEIAKRVGKSVPAVSNTIRLLSLPDAIKDALVAGVITEGHVRPLLSLGDLNSDKILMLNVFKTILNEDYTVWQTEEYVRKIKGRV